MKDLDKELLGWAININLASEVDYPKAISHIKTVILEALKAEMPKRKKSVENMGNEDGWQEGTPVVR